MSVKIPRRTYAICMDPREAIVCARPIRLIAEVNKTSPYTVTRSPSAAARSSATHGPKLNCTRESEHGALDLVDHQPLIIDHWGIVTGDVGVR